MFYYRSLFENSEKFDNKFRHKSMQNDDVEIDTGGENRMINNEMRFNW